MAIGERRRQIARFEWIMKAASELADRNPQSLADYVRLIGRRVQSEHLSSVAMSKLHSSSSADTRELLFDLSRVITDDGRNGYDVVRKSSEHRDLQLGRDLIFANPWHRGRLVDNLIHIGAPAPRRAWLHHPNNHSVEWWLPMGIGWVHGGNHSIMVGIVRAEGVLPASTVMDVSPLFAHVWTDGWWYHSEAKQKFAKVPCVELAAIFEIGRLMHGKGASA